MIKTEILVLWKSRIADRKASGLKVNDWCERNNVSRHAYYYWYRKVQDIVQDSSEKAFIEIPVMSSFENPEPEKVGIVIAWKDFTLQIHHSQDIPVVAELMLRLVE